MRNPEFVKAAFSAIAPRYVATNHVLSMGVDLLWRQRVVQLVSEWKPENLLDLATGTGDLALAILNAMPEIRLTGSDFCQPMLDIADRRGLDHLVCADAMHRILPVIAGWMTGHREAYDYLADSIEAFPCGQAMKALLRECGYSNITAEALNGGIASIYTAQR